MKACEINLDYMTYCPPDEEYAETAEMLADQLAMVLSMQNKMNMLYAQDDEDPFGAF